MRQTVNTIKNYLFSLRDDISGIGSRIGTYLKTFQKGRICVPDDPLKRSYYLRSCIDSKFS